MSYARTSAFPPESQSLARFSKTITHPARVEILRMLRVKPLIAFPSICAIIPLSPPVVSQHLEILVRAGLVRAFSDGPRSWFSLNQTRWNAMLIALSAFTIMESPHFSS